MFFRDQLASRIIVKRKILIRSLKIAVFLTTLDWFLRVSSTESSNSACILAAWRPGYACRSLLGVGRRSHQSRLNQGSEASPGRPGKSTEDNDRSPGRDQKQRPKSQLAGRPPDRSGRTRCKTREPRFNGSRMPSRPAMLRPPDEFQLISEFD